MSKLRLAWLRWVAAASVLLAGCRPDRAAAPRAEADAPSPPPVVAPATRPTTRAVIDPLSADEALYELAFRMLLVRRFPGEDCVLVLTENDAEVAIPPRVVRRLSEAHFEFVTADQFSGGSPNLPADFGSDVPGHSLVILHVGVLERADEDNVKLELGVIRQRAAFSSSDVVYAERGDDGRWGFRSGGTD